MPSGAAAHASLQREEVASPSRHVQLALVHVPGPAHAIEAQPYLRVSLNVGPSYVIDLEGPRGPRQFTSRRNSLLIIPPDFAVQHRAGLPKPAGRPYAQVELATFRISRELMEECAMHLGLAGRDGRIEHQVMESDDVLRPMAQALLAELKAGCPDGPLVAERLASAFLCCVLQRQARSGPRATAAALARAQAHIEANLQRAISLDELAQVAGMSRFHFVRVFDAAFGATPHQYILAQRIEQAKRMLWAADAPPMLEVALACGFGSASHFSAQFKKHAGKTPLAWQKSRPGQPKG
jgi:AraC-like DNA-binding protein